MGVHHARIGNALADGGGHAEVEHEDRHKVEKGRKDNGLRGFEHTRGNHGGNRVGRVMKPVHEVEQNGQRHQHDHDP